MAKEEKNGKRENKSLFVSVAYCGLRTCIIVNIMTEKSGTEIAWQMYSDLNKVIDAAGKHGHI